MAPGAALSPVCFPCLRWMRMEFGHVQRKVLVIPLGQLCVVPVASGAQIPGRIHQRSPSCPALG